MATIKYVTILAILLSFCACGAASPTMPTQIPTAIESADAVDLNFVEISKDVIPAMEDSALAANLNYGFTRSNYETECPEDEDVFNIRCRAYKMFYYPESDPDYRPMLDNPYGAENIYVVIDGLDFGVDIFQHGFSGDILGNAVDIEDGGYFYGPSYCNRQDALMSVNSFFNITSELECYLIDTENGNITAPFFGTTDPYAVLTNLTIPIDDGLRKTVFSQAWRLDGTTDEKETYILSSNLDNNDADESNNYVTLAFYNSKTTHLSLQDVFRSDRTVDNDSGFFMRRFDIDGIRSENAFSIRVLRVNTKTSSESDDISNINDYVNLIGYGISRGAGNRFLLRSDCYTEGPNRQYGYHCYDGETKVMLAESISSDPLSISIPEECAQYADEISQISFIKVDSSEMPFATFDAVLDLGP